RPNYIVVVRPPQLVVSPASRDYGTVATGQTSNQTFSVINLGDLALSGTVTGAGPFAVTAGNPYNVAAGQTQTVTVGFSPVAAGGFTNNVVFSSNGGGSTNPVTGTGAVVPVALFSGSPTNGAAPLTVTFTDTSTGTITNRNWSFGDGGVTNT